MTSGSPELQGTYGAVSSTHWLSTAAGMSVLEDGGNAFDAAVAAGFALSVVEPQSNGLGGDACIILYSAATGRTTVVSGQGPMPTAATLERLTSLGLRQIPGSGLLPATVPGAFGAWLRVLGEFGTISLRAALARAIGYAEGGHPLVPEAARAVASMAPLFATAWEGSAATYLDRSGRPIAAGRRIRYPQLSATLARLLAEAESAGAGRERQIEAARKAFYEGFVAEAVDEFCAQEVLDSTGNHNSGLLTGEDLARWSAPVEESLSVTYRGLEVHKSGPWSQGPVFLQQLALLEGLDVGALELGGTDYVHLVTEVAKLAFADREAWYGDRPDGRETIGALLHPAALERRRALIGPRSILDPTPTDLPGRIGILPDIAPNPLAAEQPDWMVQLQSGMPSPVPLAALRASLKPGDTCVVTATDRHGNLVAAVPSGGWLKSSPVIPALGFPLGTRGQSMWLTSGHPNSVEPGKRPRTTLSPTIVLRDGAPYLAFGTPGGDRQDQWTLEAFLAVVDFDVDLQRAADLPLFHTDHFPASFTPRARRRNTIAIEAENGAPVIAELTARGHRVAAVPPMSVGSKTCVVAAPGPEGIVRAAAGTRGRQAQAQCR